LCLVLGVLPKPPRARTAITSSALQAHTALSDLTFLTVSLERTFLGGINAGFLTTLWLQDFLGRNQLFNLLLKKFSGGISLRFLTLLTQGHFNQFTLFNPFTGGNLRWNQLTLFSPPIQEHFKAESVEVF
jgi:hypothetical protein